MAPRRCATTTAPRLDRAATRRWCGRPCSIVPNTQRSTSATRTSLSVFSGFPRWTAGRRQHAEASMAASSRWTRGQGLLLHPACRSTTIPGADEAFEVTRDRRRNAGQQGPERRASPGQPTHTEWLKTQRRQSFRTSPSGRHAPVAAFRRPERGNALLSCSSNQFSNH